MNEVATSNGANALNPRRLILELLDAAPDEMGTSARLLAAGELFGFGNNPMRVALSRLVQDGLLANPQRGRYQLSGSGATVHAEIQGWQQLERRIAPWQGDWCALVTDNLAAQGSTASRAQSRALQLRGLRRWRPGIWVRPDNLVGGLERLCEDVTALGLDTIAASYVMQQTDSACEDSLLALWDTAAISADYQARIEEVQAALKRLKTTNTTAVLVETVELGGDMIRALLKDPLLPDALLGNSYRQQLISLMQRYDSQGRKLWLQFIEQL